MRFSFSPWNPLFLGLFEVFGLVWCQWSLTLLLLENCCFPSTNFLIQRDSFTSSFIVRLRSFFFTTSAQVSSRRVTTLGVRGNAVWVTSDSLSSVVGNRTKMGLSTPRISLLEGLSVSGVYKPLLRCLTHRTVFVWIIVVQTLFLVK